MSLVPGKDFPDPDVVATNSSGTSAQIYATGGINNPQPGPGAVPVNIIEESWITGTSTTTGPAEALPQLPTHAVSAQTYAPAVYLFGNNYVMWFTGMSTRPCASGCRAANELFSATSTASHRGPFTPVSEIADFAGQIGLFDPSFAFDTSLRPYLLYVSEHGKVTADNKLYTQKLAPGGDTFDNSSPTFLFSYADLSSHINWSGQGRNPQIENPVMTYEPHPYFNQALQQTVTINMFLSVGSYNDPTVPNAYRTYEVDCASILGPCDTSHPTQVDNLLQGDASNPQNLRNIGGEAFLEGSGVNIERFTVFAAEHPGRTQSTDVLIRNPYFLHTQLPDAQSSEASLNGGQSLSKGQCLCNYTTGWSVGFTASGDLNLYDPSGQSHWHSATTGSSGVFAKVGTDGNFAVYDTGGPPQNPSTTAGHPGARLVLTNHNNLEIIDVNGTVLTSTQTGPPG